MLKKLGIHTICGIYIKIIFENQLKRDLFLLQILNSLGFGFDGAVMERTKKKVKEKQEGSDIEN